MSTIIQSPSIPQDIKKAHLRYVSDDSAGLTRQKAGRDFVYINTKGDKITDPETLSRIEKLAIPPAWEHVWICPSAIGHIQATGRDEKGKKQYIYHTDWNELMQQNKFNKLVSFSEILPHLRNEVEAGMQERTLTLRRILSTIVWLLQKTYIRIGNEEYAEQNQSYGLTTLRNKHVDISGDTVKFEFKGKSGKVHNVKIEHPRVAATIRRLEELPGYELFQYIDEEGQRHAVDSDHVNEYLKTVTGENISAKDFRTWGGTVYAGESLYAIGPFASEAEAKKNIASAVKKVSEHLRNTTSVCKCYYIHPIIIESYEKERLISHFDEIRKKKDEKPERLTIKEFSVATLLQKYA